MQRIEKGTSKQLIKVAECNGIFQDSFFIFGREDLRKGNVSDLRREWVSVMFFWNRISLMSSIIIQSVNVEERNENGSSCS